MVYSAALSFFESPPFCAARRQHERRARARERAARRGERGGTCCTPTVNHRAIPDTAQKQALSPLAWVLTALAPVYRLYRLHTRQKYEQQEPVWPPTALRTAPGAQPLHALRRRGGRLSPLGEASSVARAGKAALIRRCPPRGLASAAQKWPASVRPALVSVREGRKSLSLQWRAGGREAPLGEASSAARAGKAAWIRPCSPRGRASAAQKWPASVRPALVSVRDGRNSRFARFGPCQLTFPAMCGEEPTTPRMAVFLLVDNTT